jgi:uncharacterized membrane protein
MKRLYPGILAIMLLACMVAPGLAAPYRFTTLMYPESIMTGAYGINDLGQIVGEYFVPGDFYPKGFTYTNGAYTPFNIPDATGTTLNGCNNAGDLVGSYSTADAKYPFLYSSTGKLTTIMLTGANWGEARSINQNGVIVGDCTVSGIYHGFKYENGTPSFINYPEALETRTFGINDAGAIVGEFKDLSDVWRGFILENGQTKIIAVPDAVETRPNGINNSGVIVGEYSYDNDIDHGFILVNGTFTTIDSPGAMSTSIDRVNNYNQIVGWYDNNGYLGLPISLAWLNLLMD